MEQAGFFRTGFRGFNKKDVFAYLEQAEQQHAEETAALQQQIETLKQENARLQQTAQQAEQQAQQASEAALAAQQTAELLQAENLRLTEQNASLQKQAEQNQEQYMQAKDQLQVLAQKNAKLSAVVGEKAELAQRIEQAGRTYLDRSLDFGKASLAALQNTLASLQQQLEHSAEQAQQLQQWMQKQTADVSSCADPAKADAPDCFFRSAADDGRQQ